MSGLWHPVGPHSAATYWLRRALVLGVLAAVIALVIALATPARRQQAVPAAAPASPTVLSTALTATPAASPGDAPSPSASTAAPSGSSSPPVTASARSTAKPEPTARRPAAKAPKPRPRPLLSCDPSQLRVTLTGPGALKPSQPGTFALSVINGSAANCLARVTGENFELRIYSGLDRIWSSRDCPTAVKPLKQKLAAEGAVEWRMTWNGRRSAPKCASRPETPRPGTYIATAELSRADPVQRRIILRG